MGLFGGPNVDKLATKRDLKGLAKALTNGDSEVRASAGRALAAIDGDDVVHAVAERLEGQQDEAVIDSGVLPGHPDLAPKLLPGYDFVEADFSGDGDGRDGDPTDPGGSFHGSHVAGTAAAATNNGVGVAGVSWGARLLPVRVLGVEAGAGTLADAIDGILWSVGASVPGVPRNPNPADVLNLSLGGPFLCSQAQGFQEAFYRAAAAGASVVVAAGNDNDDASYFTPSSCGGVLVVGATTFRNERAPYSNFGARLDVMAPGGNLNEDADGDGFPDGVLSSVFDLAAFWLLWRVLQAGEATFQTAWFVLSLLTELVVALVLRTRGPMFGSAPGPLLLGSTVAVGVVALGLPFVTPLAPLLGFVPLPFLTVLALGALVAAYAASTELVKRRCSEPERCSVFCSSSKVA